MSTNATGRAPGTVVAVIVAILAGVCVYAVRQADADLFGYLAYGRYFLEHGLPAGDDPFSYTSHGTPWVAFEYLSQIALWTAYHHLGPAGLIALKCVLGGAAVALLWMATRTASDNAVVWMPVFLLSASTLGRYFLFRPQLFTFLFFALFVEVLIRGLLRRRAPLWLLPLAMLLWVNLHGGFLAGLGAIGLVLLLRAAQAIGERDGTAAAVLGATRPLLTAFVLSVIATFANPWGTGLWRYVLTELTHDTNRRYIAEWRPAFSGADPWSAVALTSMTSVLLLVGGLATRRRLTVAGLAPWLWALSAAPLVVMSYASVRHVPLAAIWIAPVIALLAGALSRTRASVFAPAWIVVGVCAVVPVLLTVQYVVQHPRPAIASGGRLLGQTNPCRVTRFLTTNGIEGNVYNPLWWGSYLTWHTYPSMRVAMDGRNISAFPREAVESNLRFYSSGVTAGDIDVPLREATDLLLVPADAKVLAAVRNDARWTRIYTDSDADLFARSGGPFSALADHTAAPAVEPCSATLE